MQRGGAGERGEREIWPVGQQFADRRLLAAAGGHVERVGHDLGLGLGRTRPARAVDGVAGAAGDRGPRPEPPGRTEEGPDPRHVAQAGGGVEVGSTPPATRARAQSRAWRVTAHESGV